MPMLLGNKGEEILKWRASAELVAALKEKLAWKWEHSPTGQSNSFLEQLTGTLREELEYELRLSREFEALLEGVAAAATPAEILPLKARYLEEAGRHFRRRRSVLALCGLLTELHDRILSRAVAFAAERLLLQGQGSVPSYALFVSGDRGRSEQTLRGENRYFLVHEEQSSRFFLFRNQVVTALMEVGLLSSDQGLWHGSLKEWRAFPAGGEDDPSPEEFLTPLPSFTPPRARVRELSPGAARLVELADLVFIQGDSSLASEALAGAANQLLAQRSRDSFQRLARRSMVLPVALGRFGRWRLERDGAHRGEVDLNRLALDPLVHTLRVLTLSAATGSCGTVDRIHRLQEKGVLDVDLAERLLKAYQEIMQLKVERELNDEEGCYLKPEELDQEGETRIRAAMEAVLTLQKVCYQRLGGAG